jgi:hypothetical protein
MPDWTLVPALVALRAEFNWLSARRDTRSDGSIGDRAHADRPSDHNPDETGETPYEDADSRNEVHALDIDDTGPWPAPFTSMVDEIVKRHRQGLDDRLQNVIYNGRIASRSWGWTWRDYDGQNRHTEHAHFSNRYTSAHEASTRPWGLLARFQEDTMPTAKEVATEVWAHPMTLPDGRTVTAETVLEWRDAAEIGTRESIKAAIAEAVAPLAAELAEIKGRLPAPDAGTQQAAAAKPAPAPPKAAKPATAK